MHCYYYAIVFRNVSASNQCAVVEEATYNPLICYENSLWTKKQPAIFGSVVGKSSRPPYAEQGLGLSLQQCLSLAQISSVWLACCSVSVRMRVTVLLVGRASIK
jgi:hypothetical protein